jgi:hypothetical protein
LTEDAVPDTSPGFVATGREGTLVHDRLAGDAVRLLTDRLTGLGRRAIRLDDGTPEWRPADPPVAAGDPA